MSDPANNDAVDPANGGDFFREARDDLAGPLDGMRVLEVTSTWAGPRCGAMLADYGADVVKIESPASPDVAHRLPPFLEQADPPLSFVDAAVNRNKRNIALDLTHAAGREVFLQLARGADVVIENFRPGRMASLGCGYEDVRAVKPDVVYVSISGYGQYGPYRDRGGYDPQGQAMSGLMWLNTVDGAVPTKVPIYLADEMAGLHAAFATLAALRHRDAHGEGQHIDVSLLDAMVASSTGQPTLAAQGLPTPRLGNIYPFGSPANVYECRDGWLYAGVLLDTHWVKLASCWAVAELGRHPDYATIPARVARREELDQLLGDYCAARTRDEVVEAIAALGLCVEKIFTPAEMVADPHVQVRGTIQCVRQPSGAEVRVEGPAAKMSRTPVSVRRAAPSHGADTDEVLAAAGIDDERRAELREQGVI